MQEYIEKKLLMYQLRRMLFSGFEITNGVIIIPLLLFYLERPLVCKKNYRFADYTPVKRFSNFVQSLSMLLVKKTRFSSLGSLRNYEVACKQLV